MSTCPYLKELDSGTLALGLPFFPPMVLSLTQQSSWAIALHAAFAYPFLSFSNSELEGTWGEGGRLGRKGEVLGWVTGTGIKMCLIWGFHGSQMFPMDNWHSSLFCETLTVLVISLFRPPLLYSEIEAIKASNVEWRRGWVQNRCLIWVTVSPDRWHELSLR